MQPGAEQAGGFAEQFPNYSSQTNVTKAWSVVFASSAFEEVTPPK